LLTTIKKFNSVVKPGSIIFTNSVNAEDDNKVKIVLEIITSVSVYINYDGTTTEQQDVLVYDSTKVFVEPLFADMDTII
jgi:hypothetical protein